MKIIKRFILFSIYLITITNASGNLIKYFNKEFSKNNLAEIEKEIDVNIGYFPYPPQINPQKPLFNKLNEENLFLIKHADAFVTLEESYLLIKELEIIDNQFCFQQKKLLEQEINYFWNKIIEPNIKIFNTAILIAAKRNAFRIIKKHVCKENINIKDIFNKPLSDIALNNKSSESLEIILSKKSEYSSQNINSNKK